MPGIHTNFGLLIILDVCLAPKQRSFPPTICALLERIFCTMDQTTRDCVEGVGCDHVLERRWFMKLDSTFKQKMCIDSCKLHTLKLAMRASRSTMDLFYVSGPRKHEGEQ